jgi:hypothetical protein
VLFSIDGSLDCGQPVPPASEAAFNAAFRPADEAVCVWTDERQPDQLRAAFDVEADELDAAITAALDELRSAVQAASITARPTLVVAMSEDSQARWTE